MKTKIIYISGGDAFNPEEVRNAFDEVRKMLGLADDTVLFGIPTDSDYIKDVKRETRNVKRETKIEAATEPVADKPIPILSVLGAKESEEWKVESGDNIEPEKETIPKNIDLSEEVREIAKPAEKLEDIFDKLSPLQEEKFISSAIEPSPLDTDLDPVLQKMAIEIAVTEEPLPEKPVKTSRLKNILPFKKAKKEESTSMLGDLFGWGGIAANDEDSFPATGAFGRQ